MPATWYSSGRSARRERRVWQPRKSALFFLACCFLFQSRLVAQIRPIRRVLILNEVGSSYPITELVDHGIRSILTNSPYQLEFYSEYFDTTLFPDPNTQKEFHDFYIRKYQKRKPDVIITVGPSPLAFMSEVHERFFPDVPVVFCAPNRSARPVRLDTDFTGVEGDVAPGATVAAALRLLPDTKRIFVVTGVAAFDRQRQAVIEQELRPYQAHLDISYLTDLAMPDLLKRLTDLPRQSLVLLSAVGQDAAGTRFKSSESGPMIAAASNVPIFSLSDRFFNHGEVGGSLSSAEEEGKAAGGMALRILKGEKPQDIAPQKSATLYIFDSLALKRWRMKESALPRGSIVINRQPSFWEAYGLYVLAAILVLLLQTVAIVGLLWQRARRRKTESALRTSEQKFSKAFRRSPLCFTIASLVNYRFVEVNDTFELSTGWRRDEVIGRTPLDLKIWVDTNERSAFIDQLRKQGAVRSMELLFRRRDGSVWTGLVSSELIDVNGESCALSLITDITEVKRAEEALADISRKLVQVQEEERTRIARDLHDDINQRLAMLAVEIQQLKEGPPPPTEMSRRLAEVRKRLTDISADVQSISHELHSPQLEYLGVAAAMKSFCREFSQRQSLAIDFRDNDIPQSISNDVSLCLFRVLQEALTNAAKHSQVRQFEVRFTYSDGELDLMIVDRGTGFDPDKAINKEGLGLVSMRERVRLVGGTIAIDSKPMSGTTIKVRIPVRPERTLTRAAV